jgi:cell filamentation protein
VLSNLIGIRSVREMDRVEQRSLLLTTEWALSAFSAGHRFSSDDIRRIHHRWLGDIYAWAGEYRQVNVSKGGFMFAAAAQVPRLMEEFDAECLSNNEARPSSPADKLAAVARAHAELLLIHPFREGNGRLARLLAVLMAMQAGFRKPSFEPLLRHHREEYFAAVRAGLGRDYEPMRRLFTLIVDERGL